MNTVTAYLPASEIILDAAQAVNDEGFRALSRPFYMSQVQQAIGELAYDTAYQERHWEEVIPSTRKIKLPGDVANITAVYLFNGEACDITSAAVCHIKQNFNHKGGQGYNAWNKFDNRPDPIIPSSGYSEPANLHYYGVRDGYIMLSTSSSVYQKIRVEYAGTGVKFGDDPRVPEFARQAITEYVIHRAARRRQHENPNLFRPIMNDAQRQLEDPRGAWITARSRVAMMSKAERKDMYSYMTRYTNMI